MIDIAMKSPEETLKRFALHHGKKTFFQRDFVTWFENEFPEFDPQLWDAVFALSDVIETAPGIFETPYEV